jgi:hypothetical protein
VERCNKGRREGEGGQEERGGSRRVVILFLTFKSLGFVFPKMAPSNATLAEELGLKPGEDRTAGTQAGYFLISEV